MVPKGFPVALASQEQWLRHDGTLVFLLLLQGAMPARIFDGTLLSHRLMVEFEQSWPATITSMAYLERDEPKRNILTPVMSASILMSGAHP